MKKSASILKTTLKTILPLIVLAVAIFGFSRMKRQPPKPRPQPTGEAVPVQTVKVEKHEGSFDFTVNGIVVPFREKPIPAEVAGRIVKKADVFRTGRFVKKDTVLAEIYERDYLLEVKLLEEKHKQAKRSVAELDVEIANTAKPILVAKDNLKLQQRKYQRESRLRRTGAAAQLALEEMEQLVLNARDDLLKKENQARLLNHVESACSVSRNVWISNWKKPGSITSVRRFSRRSMESSFLIRSRSTPTSPKAKRSP